MSFRSQYVDNPVMDPKEIEKMIERGLGGATARVETDGQGHYQALVVSAEFDGKRSVQRHRMVYDTLGTLVGGEIHALAVKTFTPDEWQATAR